MDAKDWEILKTLYYERSITKAAKVLFTSQPALSKRIQNLEDEFSVTIITRSKKGITFTTEGEYLVNYAIDMINLLQQTKDNLNNLKSQQIEGTLRIGVSINFAYKNLPEILKGFTNQFPFIRTHVNSGYSSEIIKLIREEQVQLAIVRGEFDWEDTKIVLSEESICLVSSKEIALEDLPFQPRINFKTDPQLKKTLDIWWRENYTEDGVTTMEVANSQIAVEMVSQGIGYAIMPKFSLNADSSDLYIKELSHKNGNKFMRKTYLIYYENDLALSTVREFVDFIKKKFG